MPNLNKVMLMGNLTRDPELRYTPNNTAVANIGMAINRDWKNQSGERQQETTFVDIEAWGRQAELLSQYLTKGRPLFVEGRLKLDQWQDKEGGNRSKLKVVLESFQFIDARPAGQGNGNPPPSASGSGSSAPAAPAAQNQGSAAAGGYSSGGNDDYASGSTAGAPAHQPIEEEDIPF